MCWVEVKREWKGRISSNSSILHSICGDIAEFTSALGRREEIEGEGEEEGEEEEGEGREGEREKRYGEEAEGVKWYL